MRLVIIDHGQANLYSLANACAACGVAAEIVADPRCLMDADAVLLPGVGAFGRTMDELRRLDFVEPIRRYAAAGGPLLGICLGMQILFDTSEEFGVHAGLGLVPGRVRFLGNEALAAQTKLPHIGWAPVTCPTRTAMMSGLHGRPMYFVHSFHAVPADTRVIAATATFGGIPFAAAVQHGNVHGCQFHPERSADGGLRLITNFLDFVSKRRAS